MSAAPKRKAASADRELLDALADAMTRAARGDLDVRLPPVEGDGSAARASLAFNQLLDQADAFVREATGSLAAAAAGDFHRKFLTRGMKGSFRIAAGGINSASDVMSKNAGELAAAELARVEATRRADRALLENVVDMSVASSNMWARSARVEWATKETQQATTTMAAAVEQLSASISDIERAARSTADSSNDAHAVTEEGHATVTAVVALMQSAMNDFGALSSRHAEVHAAVENLSSIVKVITRIAEQTNLLAVNATIEAARAGVVGKGFAVVASEVKSLSRQTRTATDSIGERIDGLLTSFKQMDEVVSHVQASARTVGERVEGLSGVFERIRTGAEGINREVSGLAGILGEQKSAVGALARDMQSVKESSDSTMRAVTRLGEHLTANLEVVERLRGELSQVDVPLRDVHLAKADHALWKKTVLEFAFGSRSDLAVIKPPDQCRLGKWLARQTPAPWLDEIREPHHRVHAEGLLAAKCFVAHELEAGLAHYDQLEDASDQVIKVLSGLILSGRVTDGV